MQLYSSTWLRKREIDGWLIIICWSLRVLFSVFELTLNKLNPNKPMYFIVKCQIFFFVSNRLHPTNPLCQVEEKYLIVFVYGFTFMKSLWGDPAGLKRRVVPIRCHWYSAPSAAQTFPTWRDEQYAIAYACGDDPSCRILCRIRNKRASSHLNG